MRARAGAPLMAVVKAGGFGLGAENVARAALAGGASELGVATCDEALTLREAGVDAPVMAWMLHPGARLVEAIRAEVALSCASVGQLAAVATAAATAGVRAVVELETETGMHRSGCSEAEWGELFQAAVAAERRGDITVRGIWTHFGVTADDPSAFNEPLQRLHAAWRTASALGLRPRRRHAASSLAASIAPAAALDLVRVGAALFGIEPVLSRPLGLEAVVRWQTSVVQLREVRAGAAIGYGAGYRAPRDGRVALLPLGYADGIPRSAWPGLAVAIAGRQHPVVGAVSMDQCVVDIGDASVQVGDQAVLLGDGSGGEPTLAEWARLLGTIPQEVLTRIGSRVQRVWEGAER